MEGIEKITARIIEDAEREIAAMQQETEEEVNTLLAQAQTEAEQESMELLIRGRRAAEERRERLSSSADMECRKLELAAKQELLQQSFDAALEELCALPQERYVTLLSALAVEASSSGRERMILSARDADRLGEDIVKAANAALQKAGRRGELTLSQETRPIPGGFILAEGDVELNCAFDTLIQLQREKLEKEVAAILFPAQ
ncbi:MAG: V-type ATP synthase subunit E [Angelakisella sp.]|nr:V-type ATP synthase subunit E [Angelakisella sp.]